MVLVSSSRQSGPDHVALRLVRDRPETTWVRKPTSDIERELQAAFRTARDGKTQELFEIALAPENREHRQILVAGEFPLVVKASHGKEIGEVLKEFKPGNMAELLRGIKGSRIHVTGMPLLNHMALDDRDVAATVSEDKTPARLGLKFTDREKGIVITLADIMWQAHPSLRSRILETSSKFPTALFGFGRLEPNVLPEGLY